MTNKVNAFFAKIHRFIKRSLYFNEVSILYKHKYFINQTSIANIRKVDYKNISDLLNFQDKKYLKIFNNFLDVGDIGYYAYLNGKCIHRSWVQFGEKEVKVHRFLKRKIKKNEAFIHYCETAPWARGKNIYASVLSKIVNDFRDKYNDFYISTDNKNIASQKGLIKAGFVETERNRILIILGIKRINLIKGK
ncbi:MAG: hypothetical protein ACP6IY_19900 [Promethearchaeia archaeon]